MAYVAVTGGREAIEKSIELLGMQRTRGGAVLEIEAVRGRMGLLLERVMGEAGFYAPDYAALALKQSEGSLEEAVFLLRAYRSTLPRNHMCLPLDMGDARIVRRISAAFKDIPGGQFLGATYDYTHRLLDFALLRETPQRVREIKQKWESFTQCAEPIRSARVSQLLRDEGLISAVTDDSEPADITLEPLTFPVPRSARLQTLARAETGYVCALAYAGIRGFGPAHPTVGELRTGYMQVCVPHPLLPGETLCTGEVLLTEVESLFSLEEETAREEVDDPLRRMQAGQGDRADASANRLALGIGYGLVMGRGDNKAIAMSILDFMLDTTGDSPLQDDEFVLLHGDCLEMGGFISHLKLPHYVTFQSKLDRVRRTRDTEVKPIG